MQSFSKTFANSLRGIMQIGIIGSHLHYALGGAFLLFLVANKLGTSIISMYFFISGFGLMTNLLRSKGNDKTWSGFFSRRVWGIFKVLFFISLLFLGLTYFDSGFFPSHLFENLFFHGITPLPNSWFVFSLIFLYVSFFLAFRWLSPNSKWGMVILSFLIVGGMFWCIFMGYERAWWVTNLAFLSGVCYAKYEDEFFSFVNSWYGFLVFVAIVIGLMLTNLEFLLSLTYLYIPIIAIVLLHRLGYVSWIENNYEGSSKSVQWLDKKTKSIFNFLSKISYELYLVHGMIIALFRGKHIYIKSDGLYIFSVFTGAILLAYLLHSLFNVSLRKSKHS